MQRRKLFLCAPVLLAPAFLSACGISGMKIDDLPKSEVQGSKKQIREAILGYASAKGYQIEKNDGKAVTLRYPALNTARGQEFFARYRVDYGDGWYRIRFIESKGLNEEKDEQRGRIGHRKINQWQVQMDRGIRNRVAGGK